MKKIFTLIVMVLCATALFAQAPEKFSYQAVVRNASNALVSNAPVGVRVSVLQGGVNGTLVYMETHTAVTNANGLMTLQIGGGNVQQGSFADIDWANGSYFLKTETDPDGGSNYSITSTQQLLSVPYALYAKDAGNGFSGDYNDLTNTPTIPTVPTNVSAFSNDAGYITNADIPTIPTVPTNVSAFTNDAGYITGYTETDPQFNAWDKDYNDLINKPTIPTVPTNVSAFVNDVPYLTSFTEQQVLTISNDTIFLTGGSYVKLPAAIGFSGDYNDLVNTPTIPAVPTNVSAFVNDVPYLTSFTEQQVLTISNDTVFLTGGSFVKLPEGFSGDYNDLINTPTIPTVPTNVSAFTNDAGYITGYTETDPQFNAWDKDYNDLINRPTIPNVPANVSAFTNDAGYITSADIPEIPTMPTNVSAFTNDVGYITDYTETDPNVPAWAREATKPAYDYSEITNTPAIPIVPMNVSAFVNDVPYLTSFTEQQVLTISNDTIFLTGGSFVKLPAAAVGFSGDYNDLVNTPTIPTVPTNVSAFNNDAGYIIGYTETDPQFNAWDKDYNDLINTPQIPTVPTNVSVFNNDAGYITNADIPEIPTVPTNVSSFTNDAGYLTSYTETDPNVPAWAKEATKPAYDYSEIANTPEIPTVPTNVSAFNNDAGYLIEEAQTLSDVTAQGNSAGSRQLKDVSDPTEAYDAVNLHVLTQMMDSVWLRLQKMQNQVDSLQALINNMCPCTQDFVCGTSTVTDYDGNVYNTVQIGSQCWMKENLRTTHYADGTAIPAGASNYSNTAPYYYDYSSSNIPLVQRGYLYNWSAAMHGAESSSANPSGVQGICPTGWHMPSDAEWTTMEATQTSIDVTSTGWRGDHAGKLAGEGWSSSSTANAPGNVADTNHNASGFTAVPAGYWGYGCYAAGHATYFWSSTEYGTDDVWTLYLQYDAVSIYRSGTSKGVGYSVRCLRDAGNTSLLPTVTTSTVVSVTSNSATCGGNVTDNGGSAVTARGVCWSISQNPTFSDSHTSDGSGTGSFNSSIAGLSPNTTYYVRAYATNSVGTAYGNTLEFTTLCDNGGTTEFEQVACYSYTWNGTVYNATGEYTQTLTNMSGCDSLVTMHLTVYQTYSVTDAQTICASELPYIWNGITFTAAGTQTVTLNSVNGCDSVVTMTLAVMNCTAVGGQPCPGAPTVTDYDGNVYNTVQIGNQCWMKENLRTTHFANGDSIIVNPSTFYTNTAYIVAPNNGNNANVATYGYLYNWLATMHGASSSSSNPSLVQGACPTGWHVPSDAEWDQLVDYVSSVPEYLCEGNSIYIAKSLGATFGWNSSGGYCHVGNNLSANNATGFSALPAGYNTVGCYNSFGYDACYWSATESDESKAFTRKLSYSSSVLYKSSSNKNYLCSVRCLCDVGNTSSLPTVITSTVASVTSYSATCGGNVSYNGAVTARGVCWSTSQNPTISNSHTEDGTGTGTFTSDLTGLAPSTTYHVRAYATNSMGTAYGNEVTFTTLSVPVIDARSCSAALTVTDHEGNVYATVQIGDQCWMRDNLRTTTSPSTGTYLIPYAITGSTFTGKQARWYNNAPTTNAPMNYGLLYNWNAAVDTFNTSYGETSVDPYVNHAVSVNFTGHRRGICPTGWHLPSDSEWTQLTNYVKTQDYYICGDTDINIGKALASTEGWYSYNGECYPGDQSQHANNATGFSAVPAGYCTGLSFYGAGYRANFWSSSQSTSINANSRYLLYRYASLYSDNASKNDGCSVRCLRD